MFEDLRCDSDKKACILDDEDYPIEKTNFFLPKLSAEELKLVSNKDETFLKTFENFTKVFENVDVDDAEMKLSESKSKYIHGGWSRMTYIISIDD